MSKSKSKRIEYRRTERGIVIGEGGSSSAREIVLVNPENRWYADGKSFVLYFGDGETVLRVWERHLEDAVETAAEWIAKHAPGHIMAYGSEEHTELIKDACKEVGIPFDEAHDRFDEVLETAEADLTYTESGYLAFYEWGVLAEDPTRAEIAELIGL